MEDGEASALAWWWWWRREGLATHAVARERERERATKKQLRVCEGGGDDDNDGGNRDGGTVVELVLELAALLVRLWPRKRARLREAEPNSIWCGATKTEHER